MSASIAVLTTLAVHLGSIQLAADATAQDAEVPTGTVSAGDATASTEVAGQGTFATADEDARNADDATELEISAGGVLATGNAYAAAVTAQGRLRIRRGIHQFGSQVAANYGRADVELLDANGISEGIERQTTVANLQGMARYDVFFAKRWSAFLMAVARRDRFQGLDLRLNVDPGIAFYALTKKNHRLWFELGYDFQYDIRREDAVFEDQLVDTDGDGEPDTEQRVRIAEDTLVNHAVRGFVGYNNALSERVTFDTGLEYLQSVLVGSRFRLNWVNALTVQLGSRVGLGATFTLRYENEPLPDVAKLDTITALLLTVRFI